MASTDDTKERMKQLQEDTDALILLWASQWSAGVAAWDVYAAMGNDAFVAGHTQASALGRELAGDTGDSPETDAARAEAAWAEQGQYWQGFADDVQAGKYGTPGNVDELPDPDAVAKRGARFTAWYSATGNYSWVDSVADMEGEPPELWWVLDPAAAHCDDCPSIAAASPYTPDTIPTWPGVGVQCQYNCRCEVRMADHGTGFPVKID